MASSRSRSKPKKDQKEFREQAQLDFIIASKINKFDLGKIKVHDCSDFLYKGYIKSGGVKQHFYNYYLNDKLFRYGTTKTLDN